MFNQKVDKGRFNRSGSLETKSVSPEVFNERLTRAVRFEYPNATQSISVLMEMQGDKMIPAERERLTVMIKRLKGMI